jgi:CRP-like cAMP-binding protein
MNNRIGNNRTEALNNLAKRISDIVDLPLLEIESVVSMFIVEEVSAGVHIVQEGQVCDFIFYVHKGIFRTYLKADGEERNTEFFMPTSFGGAFTSFLLGATTSLNIQALSDSQICVVSKAVLESLYTSNPRWLALGKYIFEQEFIKKCRRETSLLQLSSKERYMELLRDYPEIEHDVPLFHIASYLGIKPESLSRIRSGRL